MVRLRDRTFSGGRDGGAMRRWQWCAMLVLQDDNAGSFLRAIMLSKFDARVIEKGSKQAVNC
jgi:hypothetical protein